VFPMTLLMLTMTSSRDKLTANKTSVSQLRTACLLPAAGPADAAADAGSIAGLSTARKVCVPALTADDTAAQNRSTNTHQYILYNSFCVDC